jgi:dienelactone hydrolase
MSTPTAVIVILLAMFLFAPRAAEGAIKSEPVEYKDGDTTLKGIVFYDDSTQDKRPGVVVVPEWWGINDYIQSRAKQLAEAGFVAFVADMYGDAFSTDNPKLAGQKSGEAKSGHHLRTRGKLAADQLRQNPHVLADDIAAIGFCFGGTTVLEMARDGQDLKGVVSLHGELTPVTKPAEADTIKPKILVLTGQADPIVPPEQVEKFEKEMKAAHADAQVVKYPNAKHAFTNPDAGKYKLDPIAYNEDAAKKAWTETLHFLKTVLTSGG